MNESQEKIRLAFKGIEEAGVRLGEIGQKEMKRINSEFSKIVSTIKPITLK
jgi:hypothetical protein